MIVEFSVARAAELGRELAWLGPSRPAGDAGLGTDPGASSSVPTPIGPIPNESGVAPVESTSRGEGAHRVASPLSPSRGELPPPLVREIHVDQARVLALAESSAEPHGTPVAASWWHPGGILLQGVSTLGLGLRDGDVLVSVAGAPVTSRGDVVSRVLAARGRREAAVLGIVLRLREDGRTRERVSLVVEQPYPTYEEAKTLRRGDTP